MLLGVGPIDVAFFDIDRIVTSCPGATEPEIPVLIVRKKSLMTEIESQLWVRDNHELNYDATYVNRYSFPLAVMLQLTQSLPSVSWLLVFVDSWLTVF